MGKYIKIAEKYLAVNSTHLTKGLCFTIRKSELDASNNLEELIKNRVKSINYDFRQLEAIRMVMEQNIYCSITYKNSHEIMI